MDWVAGSEEIEARVAVTAEAGTVAVAKVEGTAAPLAVTRVAAMAAAEMVVVRVVGQEVGLEVERGLARVEEWVVARVAASVAGLREVEGRSLQ